MEIQSVRIENARLTEGKVYQFRILKTVSLGPDDDWYVLEDPKGYKILLPQMHYQDYGLATGNVINCRVDKVNCNGKVFLEPEHPHYQEGKEYDFLVHCRDRRKDILGEDEYYFMVTDALNKQWKVRIASKPLWNSPPGSIKCRVMRIKKGKLYLQHANDTVRSAALKIGGNHTFTIVDEKTDPDSGKSFYILRDETGNKHLLNKKYYRHYGFGIGSRINCRVLKKAIEGYFMLEPEHPCYKRGSEYEFPVDRLEEIIFSDGSKQKSLVLLDCFGSEIKVEIDDRLLKLLGEKRFIQARLHNIRKGNLELEITDAQPI